MNPSTGYKVDIEDLESYHWSSLLCYLSGDPLSYSFMNMDLILGFFKNKNAYREFVYDQAEYQRELSNIKHLIF